MGIWILIWIFGFFPSLSWGLDWDLVPITPACRAGIYCFRDEIASRVKEAGIANRIERMAEKSLKAGGQVSFAFMSFTEESLFRTLCNYTSRGLRFEGFFDSKAGPPRGLAHRLENECQGPTRSNVRIRYMGMPKNGKTGWRLHHNKFVLADYGSGAMEIAFGSANLSANGLSVNFENWNFVKGSATSPFFADHLCNLRAMRMARDAGTTEDDPKVFRRTLEECLSEGKTDSITLERVLAQEGAWVLFAPDPKDQIFSLLRDQIGKVVPGGSIRLATYFFMHKPLVEELKLARKRGVEIQLLIDDDLFLGKGSIPAQKKFWNQTLRPSLTGFATRAFDTNEEIFQMQHHKFIILKGVGDLQTTRVFGGAGQFTLSAFKNNFENFYFIGVPHVIDQYEALFSMLWQQASEVYD